MKPGGGRGGHQLTGLHIAVPVHVADAAAFTERPASGDQVVAAFRRDRAQDHSPPPAHRGVARGIRAVAA